MVTTLEALNKALIDFMRANVSDPTSRGVTWIYTDYPRKIKTFPMINLTNIGSSREEIGIGDQGSRLNFIYLLEVWTTSTNEATISGNRYSGTLLRDYLADSLITVFNNNRTYLRDTYDIMDAFVSRIDTAPFDVGKDLYRKMLTLNVTIDKPKT